VIKKEGRNKVYSFKSFVFFLKNRTGKFPF
jgi:hypothetical protein